MILDLLERAAAALQIVRPVVMKIERGAVIDQPQFAMPDEQIRIARSPIDIRDIGVEPDDRRGQIPIGNLDDRVEGDLTRQIVEREIQTGAPPDQVLDLGIGLGARQHRVEFREDDLRHR
jgi:hypothetical protein